MTETIVAAAHFYNRTHKTHSPDDPRAVPVIVSAPPPARHHNLFVCFGSQRIALPQAGFLTSTGRFVDREEALKIAIASGQPMIDHPSRHATKLFSEDLW